jgi:hypothetical protein
VRVGDDTSSAIEKGKSLVVRPQAVGETDEEGQVRVLFELNRQPRMVKVPNRDFATGQHREPDPRRMRPVCRRQESAGHPARLIDRSLNENSAGNALSTLRFKPSQA